MSRCRSILLTGLVGFAAWARPASGQESFTVQGRVVERGGQTGIVGVTVIVTGRPPVVTDEDGRFVIPRVAPGRYSLLVQGLGYAPAQRPLEVSADTTVVVELDVTPVPLDSLLVSVEGADVEVKGRVRDGARDYWLYEAEVFASPGLEKTTDPIGRFNLGDVPSGVPLTIQVRSFGYLPVTVTFTPRRDTTLIFDLVDDPVMRRMIARQMERIDERSEGRRYEYLPVLDRDELMGRESGPIIPILKRKLGSWMFRDIACYVIDERPPEIEWRLATLQVDEIQRIEVTWYPGLEPALLVRLYTREFVQEMVNGESELVQEDLAMTPVAGLCR